MSAELVLALDCSTEYLALAVVDARGGVLGRRTPHVGREHAARLPLEFEALLADVARERAAIAAVRVGIGPGSYTGTRVAIAAAKGLARALGADLAGVSSFVGLAAGVLAPGASAVITLDARRGNVYAQACRREAGSDADVPRVTALGEAMKVAIDELSERFAGLAQVAGVAPDAAALAVSSQLAAARAVYL
ncbi:MAG TPA: tRNA (adenosine(37)-N6)-threonylcarbamoyltransferase complex dimerization subunit type 1 TsaB [Trueperaceae bacterium]|nr:tRNA (adenosine(37)-N6)-threonylcarbamoyltransferase complex dimerization subunit type 1 TsaB [Trueperaceae bacterium]